MIGYYNNFNGVHFLASGFLLNTYTLDLKFFPIGHVYVNCQTFTYSYLCLLLSYQKIRLLAM